MSFGNAVRPAGSADEAEWIGAACGGGEWTVGGLVPNHFESVVRIAAPESDDGDWWALYRDMFVTVSSIGERHTATPERAWFAIYEGHGFDNFSTGVAASGVVDEQRERELEQLRATLRDQDAKRKVAIRAGLSEYPLFELPHRAYYLMEGEVSAVADLRNPGFEEWRNPDFLWPADRSWFIATDVDFWALFIGGSKGFIGELLMAFPSRAELALWSDELPIEN